MPDSDSNAEKSLPMFYRSPRPLDRSQDADLKISRPTHFRFAAETNAIPILIEEFPLASAHYPIVFADGPVPIPAAVVGLRNSENLFVDNNGQWADDTYLPAYLRRYPFILMDDADNKQFVLCIDSDSDMLGPQGEYPLFEGNEPSDFTKNAMEFCAALRQQGDLTDAFVSELRAQDLLVPNDAKIETGEGEQIQLSGFLTIDPKRFDAVSDNLFTEWRAKGWLGLIYAQLLSSHRWQNLVTLAKLPGRPTIVLPQRETSAQLNVPRPDVAEEFRLKRRPLPGLRSRTA
ncbi:SapC family protein [Granulicella aggregans]|jgi:hypothetical protein|uniref:SapC family protein n=1 Tax=Granulicella aggregans TaxID=474949 RepID=UPI0021E0A6B6|nr:SapC family protein [Granulicella aggregans]